MATEQQFVYEIYREPKSDLGERMKVGEVKSCSEVSTFLESRYDCKVIDGEMCAMGEVGEFTVDFGNGFISKYSTNIKIIN